MPGEKQVNKDFLKAVFTNEKKLLKKFEVNYISVPHWDELGAHQNELGAHQNIGFPIVLRHFPNEPHRHWDEP